MGELSLTTGFTPRDWHVHEMLYGFLSAVITGFLFTAIPNWTGRLPLRGRPLMFLLRFRLPPSRRKPSTPVSLLRRSRASAPSVLGKCSVAAPFSFALARRARNQ